MRTGCFKSYEAKEIEVEDAPTTSTAGVANWNPLLGGRKRKVDVYMKKRRSVDGRTKDYKETVTRLQARRDASAARDLEQKLNMFGVQSNPFREDTQMENKKYLKTKEGSIEDAVLQSMRTEAPSNPNDARPTLHLPEKKYLDSKEGSLERAVTDVVVTETISGNMIRDLRTLNSLQFRRKYNQTKAAVQTAGSGIQRYGRKGRDAPVSDERQEEVEDAYDYKAKKGAIAAPGSGSIAKAKKAKSSDVNKSIEQQMADARKEEMDPRQEREMLKRNVNNPAQSPKAKELMRKRISKLSQPKKEEVEMDEFYGDEKGGDARLHVPRLKNKPARQRKDALKQRLKKIGMKHAEEVEMDESWKKVKPTDRVQRLDQLSISGWLSKQMGRKGDPHKFNHKVPSIYFDDVDLVVDSDTVVPRALSGNTTMADLLKKVQAHAKKKRLRWEAVEMGEKHEPGHKPYKLPRQLKNRKTEKMVGTKKGTKVVDRNDPRYKHHPEHESVEHDDRGVGSQAYTDYIRNLTPGETAVKDKESKESSSASKQASAEKKRQVTKIDDAVDPAVKMTTDKYKQEKTKMKQDHILDVAKIKASKVGEEVIVGLLDMGIIKIDESNETGFTVINDPVANRENLLRLAYNTGAQILSEKKVSSDDYDHATALYKDQWKDRKIADYDKEHGKDSRAKEMRKDAEVDRKRMWGLTGDKWKHAKGSSGEVKGKEERSRQSRS